MSKLYLKKQVLSEQLASEGDTVEVGQAIAVIGEGSGNASKENSNDNTPQQNEETNNNNRKYWRHS